MRKGCVRTYTGNHVDCRNPDPEMIDPRDIAHHLSYEARWGGATQIPYSVAQHCIWVARFARKLVAPELRDHALAWGLLHDAHEAYIKDVPTPIKALLGEEYELMADALDLAIVARFQLCVPPEVVLAVKRADSYAAWCEAEALVARVPNLLVSGRPDAELLREVPMLTEVRRRQSPELSEQAWLSQLQFVVKQLGGRP